MTALHISLGHPAPSQLKKVFDRYFFAIKSSEVVDHVSVQCSQCSSLRKLPRQLCPQSGTVLADRPGTNFYADVMRRATQKILVTRDTFSSFTNVMLIPDETGVQLRSALILTTSLLRMDCCTVQVDNAPGFVTLRDDKLLLQKGIMLDYGRVKNVNKSCVVDKAVQELELEILKIDDSGSAVTAVQLQQATDTLNSRIRNRSLSAKEILLQRDQVTGRQLSFKDSLLSQEQQLVRQQNREYSSKSKARGASSVPDVDFSAGDLVFIRSEGDKNHGREQYLVMGIQGDKASVQKFHRGSFMSRR